MIDLLELVAFFKTVLEIRSLLPGTERRSQVVLTSRDIKSLTDRRFKLPEGVLDALPDTRENNLFKALNENLRLISYYDNLRVSSETLVFYFHGLGLDQEDFYHILMETEHRGIAPTLYGFHSSDVNPISVPFETHCYLMARFVEAILEKLTPRKIFMVGFSTGADLLLRMPRLLALDGSSIAGLLLLDCNVNRSTCFISRELRKGLHGEASTLQLARSIGTAATDITDWLDLHQYLVRVLGKFKNNVGQLARLADDVFLAQPEEGIEQFSELLRGLLSWNANSRLHFSKGDVHESILPALRSMADAYGARSCIKWERDASHFELLETNFLETSITGLL
jgi:pimeloyl-ACP methyl ester carboxylesterase